MRALLFVLALLPSLAAAQQWNRIATEFGAFTLTDSAAVRYGSGSAWVQKTLPAGSYICNNGTFANDPAPNVVKQCEQMVVAVTVPVFSQPTASQPAAPLEFTQTFLLPTDGMPNLVLGQPGSPHLLVDARLGACAWWYVYGSAPEAVGFRAYCSTWQDIPNAGGRARTVATATDPGRALAAAPQRIGSFQRLTCSPPKHICASPTGAAPALVDLVKAMNAARWPQ